MLTKSPRKVFVTGHEVGKKCLPTYSHKHSGKNYTQPQLFACLVLKQFFNTDFRGISQILADTPDLCAAIKLKKVPHFTTLQKVEAKLFSDDETFHYLARMTEMAIKKIN